MSKVRRGGCNLVLCWRMVGTRSNENTGLGDGAGMGPSGDFRSRPPQLAWGQAFPEESSFLPGSLVGGFFPDPAPPTPAGLSSQLLHDWAYQVPPSPSSELGSQLKTLPGR